MKRKLLTFVLLASLPSSPVLAGYYFDAQLGGPSTVVYTGSPASINLTLTLDTSTPPSGFLSDIGTATGSIDFGNGASTAYNFGISSVAGGMSIVSLPLSETYTIPGTYQVSGFLSFAEVAQTTSGPSAADYTVQLNPTSVVVQKDPAVKAAYQQAALAAQQATQKLNLFSGLTSINLGDIESSIAPLVSTYVGALSNNWIGLFSNVATIALGAYTGGPVGLAVASAFALANTYYSVENAVYTMLANDPPDPNYSTVYQPVSSPVAITTGLGQQADTFLDDGVSSLARVLDDLTGELVSMQRGEGALAAGDINAVALQANALSSFQVDLSSAAPSAGAFFDQLPSFLTANGADSVPGISSLYDTFYETAAELGATDVPEAPAWVIMAMGMVCLSIAVTFRPRKANQWLAPAAAPTFSLGRPRQRIPVVE